MNFNWCSWENVFAQQQHIIPNLLKQSSALPDVPAIRKKTYTTLNKTSSFQPLEMKVNELFINQ
jgi:hypothetical protein